MNRRNFFALLAAPFVARLKPEGPGIPIVWRWDECPREFEYPFGAPSPYDTKITALTLADYNEYLRTGEWSKP